MLYEPNKKCTICLKRIFYFFLTYESTLILKLHLITVVLTVYLI